MNSIRLPLLTAVAATSVALLAAGNVFATAAVSAPTPGDLLIYRGGDGTVDQAANATSVWIDEYTPSGTFVQTYGLPQTGSLALTIGSTTTTEGGLSVSLDNNWAVFTGYRADVGTTGLTTSPVPRVIGRLNLATGATDTDTSLGVSYTNPEGAAGAQGSSIRGIAATDGTHFWTAGTSKTSNENGGIVYTVGNGADAVSTVIRSANQRGIGIFGGQLYANNSGTTFTKISPNVGDSGAPGYPMLPTIPGITNSTVLGSQVNINGFLMYDLSPDVAGIDTLYFPSTDTTAVTSSLLKYTFDGTTWNPSGSVNVAGVNSGSLYNIAGKQNSNGSITFYMTSTGSPATDTSVLDTFTDSTGYNGSISGDATLLTNSPQYTTFRGLAIVPGTAVTRLPGDTNGDGVVDLTDLNNVLNNFGVTASGNPGDDNGDGVVDLSDLNDVLNNFGTHNPAASGLSVVPEPTTISLLSIGTLGLLSRRRRRA